MSGKGIKRSSAENEDEKFQPPPRSGWARENEEGQPERVPAFTFEQAVEEAYETIEGGQPFASELPEELVNPYPPWPAEIQRRVRRPRTVLRPARPEVPVQVIEEAREEQKEPPPFRNVGGRVPSRSKSLVQRNKTLEQLSLAAEEKRRESSRLLGAVQAAVQKVISETDILKTMVALPAIMNLDNGEISIHGGMPVFSVKYSGNDIMTINIGGLHVKILSGSGREYMAKLLMEAIYAMYKETNVGKACGYMIRGIVYFATEHDNRGMPIELAIPFMRDQAEDSIKERIKWLATVWVKILNWYYEMGTKTKKYEGSGSDHPIYDVKEIDLIMPGEIPLMPVYMSIVQLIPLTFNEANILGKATLNEAISLCRSYISAGYGNEDDETSLNTLLSSYSTLYGEPAQSHMLPFKSVASRIKKYVLFSGITNVGICFFEALLAARKYIEGQEPLRIYNSTEWCDYVYSEFLKLGEEDKRIFIEGNYIAYSKCELLNKYGIGAYSYSDGVLYGPESKYVVLVYANHAYVSLFEAVIGKKLSSSVKGDTNKRSYVLEAAKHCNVDEEIKHFHMAYDFETLDGGNGIQVPYLLVIYPINFKGEPEVFYGTDCAYEFVFKYLVPLISIVKEQKKTYYHFWSYNGANFDMHFIIKILSKLMPIDVTGSHLSIKKLKIGTFIEFVDLAAWYISIYDKATGRRGLDALAASCNCPIRKLPFDHKGVTFQSLQSETFKTNAITYCTRDCEVLAWLVSKLVIEAIDSFEYNGQRINNVRLYPCSAATLAKKFFEYFFCDQNIFGTADELRLQKERQSYRGGLTIALKPVASKIRVYDINSSYPAVMCELMPVHFIGARINKYTLKEPVCDYWLYGVSEFSFPEKTVLPSLMIKGSNGIVLPLEWKAQKELSYYWGCELNVALEMGAIIKIEEELHYKGEEVFKKFILYFYQKRLEAKRNGESHLVMFYKILMNSLQGKLGQRDFQAFDVGSIGGLKQQAASHFEGIKDVKLVNNECFKVTYNDAKEKCKKIGSLVRFPSYIAARGRCKLHKGAQPIIEHVAYMDTDSIFLANDKELNQNLVSSSELGKFKHETDKLSDMGIFFGAKNYVLYKSGSGANIACKGARLNFNDAYREFVVDFIKSLKNPEKVALLISDKFPLFTKRFGTVTITENYKAIKPTFNLKRITVGLSRSRPFKNIEEANKQAIHNIRREVEVKIGYIEAQVKKSAEIEARLALKDVLCDIELKRRTIRNNVAEVLKGAEEEREKIKTYIGNVEDEEIKLDFGAQIRNFDLQAWDSIVNSLLNLSDINRMVSELS